uniref:Uncharacterized protein n=1 Tax=Rhizophora mucronata TaxID=61149 RepID=A0A2P2PFB1_RHIMU
MMQSFDSLMSEFSHNKVAWLLSVS